MAVRSGHDLGFSQNPGPRVDQHPPPTMSTAHACCRSWSTRDGRGDRRPL